MAEESTVPGPYQYRPLESNETVRVLVLHPAARHNEPLRCDIDHVDQTRIWENMEADNAFDAVSYTWGSPDFCNPLICEGGKSVFMITPNINCMLRRLRHPIKQRCLWIDAICLNQADNAEKSVQVQLMGDIYRQARKVHIWLGDADARVAGVWSFLRTLVGRKAENLDIGEVEKILCDFSGKDGGERLRNFVCRPWFIRRWHLLSSWVWQKISFWFLCYILSSKSLLAEVRGEISKIVTRKTINGIDTIELDSTGFQQHCPLLISTWEETLRLVDSSSSVRMVAKDTMLTESCLLKANSIIQMPSGTTHLSTEIWGPDAATFNPRRFLKEKSNERLDAAGREKRKLQVQGYSPFGGGKHLCPGRHFVFVEVMSLVAIIVYGLDIKMADGNTEYKAPKSDLQKMGTGVRKPVNDIDMLIKQRSGFGGAKWTYTVGKETDIKNVSTGEGLA